MTSNHIVLIEIICAAAAAGIFGGIGLLFKLKHRVWIADDFFEMAGEICGLSILGVVLTKIVFADSPFQGIACTMAMTFMYPFICWSWISDAVSDYTKVKIGDLTTVCISLISVAISAVLLGFAITAHVADPGNFASGLTTGMITAGSIIVAMLISSAFLGFAPFACGG